MLNKSQNHKKCAFVFYHYNYFALCFKRALCTEQLDEAFLSLKEKSITNFVKIQVNMWPVGRERKVLIKIEIIKFY